MKTNQAVEILRGELKHALSHLNIKSQALEFYGEYGDYCTALSMAVKALENSRCLTDKNGRMIESGDAVKGLYYNGCEIVGTCYYSEREAAWGLVWSRGDSVEFTPFCSCCNIEWEVVDYESEECNEN